MLDSDNKKLSTQRLFCANSFELLLNQGRIKIMPGGGVTYENYLSVAENLNVNEAHGTKIVAFD
ncbi:hypothetical protein ACWN8V_10115 [Vagococcus elongatus]|uniref:Uncharacterized protein n=1 Tax=Vagococcus elongatus TaxID=180344 RepID=A0A430AQV2_9ENTE|nr:hypothetical protein [Vagococcus elongatus]RSU10287.1 hypothetical protein CBF29_09750 [Vagococcus elongatus]